MSSSDPDEISTNRVVPPPPVAPESEGPLAVLRNVKKYHASKTATARTVGWIFGFLTLEALVVVPFHSDSVVFPPETKVDRWLFLIYLAVFLGMWSAYFASRYSQNVSQTLRRLLIETCVNWGSALDTHTSRDAVERARTKAGSTMQAVSMLIAASAVILNQCTDTWPLVNEADVWRRVSLLAAAGFAIVAIVSFLVSVDSLDTMFNHFKCDDEERFLMRYFYFITLDPKYLGFVSMMLSLVFLIQCYSTMLATLTVGVIIALGRPLWFPRLGSLIDEATGVTAVVSGRGFGISSPDGFVARVAVVAAPVLVHMAIAIGTIVIGR